MNRRDFIAAAALAIPAFAVAGAVTDDAAPPAAETGSLDGIVAAAEHCQKTGRACLRHCMQMLGRGDASMKDCSAAVQNMLAACSAMVAIGSARTASEEDLKRLTKACAGFCRSCEAQCRTHAAKHKVCADCMDSCAACAKACEAYA